jgi:hypothetical protein
MLQGKNKKVKKSLGSVAIKERRTTTKGRKIHRDSCNGARRQSAPFLASSFFSVAFKNFSFQSGHASDYLSPEKHAGKK